MGVTCRRSPGYHVSVADTAYLSTWAIELCIRFNALPAASEVYTLVGKGGLDSTTQANYHLAYENASGTKRFILGAWDTFTEAAVTTTIDYDVEIGRWYSIAFTFDGTDAVELYITPRKSPGGSAATQYTLYSDTLSPAPVLNSSVAEPTRIGSGVTAASAIQNVGNITVSDVRIYDVAISQSTLESRISKRRSEEHT